MIEDVFLRQRKHRAAEQGRSFQTVAIGALRRMHDAHIATLRIEHGVSELVTAGRDFRRFSGLRIRDPFHA